jgi:hypothetical protein
VAGTVRGPLRVAVLQPLLGDEPHFLDRPEDARIERVLAVLGLNRSMKAF